jgi:amino acid transporter
LHRRPSVGYQLKTWRLPLGAEKLACLCLRCQLVFVCTSPGFNPSRNLDSTSQYPEHFGEHGTFLEEFQPSDPGYVMRWQASGKWLRIWVVVDAIVVLCAGVLTGQKQVLHLLLNLLTLNSGVLSASELCEQLARDRVLPRVFLKTLPVTRSPFVAILSFAGVCVAFYASSGGQLIILSQV